MKHRFREMEWVHALRNDGVTTDPAPIVTDPNGSYTGRASDPLEKPVQDADDL